MSGTYDINVEQGATFSLQITYKDPSNQPINLTGYTARMDVRTKVKATTETIELTTENGRIALGGVLGTVTLSLTAAETAAIASGKYVYDLELVNGAAVIRLIEGSFIVSPEVTR